MAVKRGTTLPLAGIALLVAVFLILAFYEQLPSPLSDIGELVWQFLKAVGSAVRAPFAYRG